MKNIEKNLKYIKEVKAEDIEWTKLFGAYSYGRKIGEDIFKERFVLGEKVYLAGDNAAYYFQKTPGIRMVFFAKRENEINYPLHNSKFDFNEDIFYYALSTIYQMVLSI